MARARTRPTAPGPSDTAADTADTALHPGAPHASGARRPLSLPPRPAELRRPRRGGLGGDGRHPHLSRSPRRRRTPCSSRSASTRARAAGSIRCRSSTASPTSPCRAWQAVLPRERVPAVMMLPEIGGRIHIGQDKTNGYDFFYRQDVIKPALVGLAGPWISGGVEFNWPQHHRPAHLHAGRLCASRSTGRRRRRLVLASTIRMHAHSRACTASACARAVAARAAGAALQPHAARRRRSSGGRTWPCAVHDHYQSFFPPDVHATWPTTPSARCPRSRSRAGTTTGSTIGRARPRPT